MENCDLSDRSVRNDTLMQEFRALLLKLPFPSLFIEFKWLINAIFAECFTSMGNSESLKNRYNGQISKL